MIVVTTRVKYKDGIWKNTRVVREAWWSTSRAGFTGICYITVLYNIHVLYYIYLHFKNTKGKTFVSSWNAVYCYDQQLGNILDYLHKLIYY